VVSFLTLVVLAFTLAEVGRYANEAHTQTGLFSKANDNAQTLFLATVNVLTYLSMTFN
jgi:hypothetical protein